MSQLDDYFQTYAMPTIQHWFGVNVTLQRGPRQTTDVVATWSRPPDEVDLEGMPLKITHRVYRIAVSAYVIGSTVAEPKRDDLIKETIQGTELTFSVLPNDRLPAFELDGDGLHWIIRTKRI
jgi:hypothetical protein